MSASDDAELVEKSDDKEDNTTEEENTGTSPVKEDQTENQSGEDEDDSSDEETLNIKRHKQNNEVKKVSSCLFCIYRLHYPSVFALRKFVLSKKVMSDSLGLVDFGFGLVNSVLNLPDGQVKFFGKFKLQTDCNQSCQSKRVLGLVEVTRGLVHASYSLPEWQAVKLTFFAPCHHNIVCMYA